MISKIATLLLIILIVFFLSNFSYSQDRHKFKAFKYDVDMTIKTEDDSAHSIINIIIARREFIISEYEQNSIRDLYSDTQNYFRSLIGNEFVVSNELSVSGDRLYVLTNGNILNYDLVRRGLAVFKYPPTDELRKYENEGFNINQKDDITNLIFLLTETEDRKDETKSLLDLYVKKFQKDYIWYPLKARMLESDDDTGVINCYKTALILRPELFDLNIDIATRYNGDILKMIKKDKPKPEFDTHRHFLGPH